MRIPQLRQWRELRGLTQRELAAESGVSLRSIAGYEAGAGVRPNTARKLAEALNIEVADFFREPEVPKAPAPPSPEQPNFNGLLGEERRIKWDAAARSARQLRERDWQRMEEVLSAWRVSKARGESPDARRGYRQEMGELLQHAYDAEMTLWRALRTNRLDQVDLDEFAELQAADRFYVELFNFVKRAGLSPRPDGAQEGQPAQAGPPEAAAHTVEEPKAA